jgi:Zn-dependent M28 family amino/carboxypeptidase
MEATEAFVVRELEASGWEVERQPFHVADEPGQLDVPGPRTPVVYPSLTGANIVAIREGEDPAAVVVVAHLDTVRDAPGADDNGSGVAAALELGRLIDGGMPHAREGAGRPWRRTVVLAFPDYEEIGLVGSRLLVERLLRERPVRAAIVLDSVGFRSPAPGSQRVPGGMGLLYPRQRRRMTAGAYAGDFTAVLYRRSSRGIARALAEASLAVTGRDEAVLLRDPGDLPTVGSLFSRLPLTRDFSRSDHRRFWDADVPAIMVSDTGNFRNPHYHRASDLPGTLDCGALGDLVAVLYLVVSALAAGV